MIKLINILPENLKQNLTEAEEKLLEAVQDGEVADFSSGEEEKDKPENASSWGIERTIRAEILCWLCTNPSTVSSLHTQGVQIKGAKIFGNLDFKFATLSYPLVMSRCAIGGTVILIEAEAYTLNLYRSLMNAVFANGLNIKKSMILNKIRAKGEVKLCGANIGGDLNCTGASFENENGKAFSADGITIKGIAFNADGLTTKRNVFLRGMQSVGDVRLPGANINGHLDCDKATFENQGRIAFGADRLTTEGGVSLKGISAKGEVRLLGASIGGNLDCTGATFENTGSKAFSVDGIHVKGNLFLKEIKATGEVRLPGANISGNLECTGTTFENSNANAFVAENAKINDTLNFYGSKIGGILNLAHAQVRQLADDEKSWPSRGNLILDGFEYRALGGDKTPVEAKKRIEWLRLQPSKHFHFQPYEQLAKMFRQMGHETDARDVLIAKQDDLRKYGTLSRKAKIWNWLLGLTIGHGYKSWKVVFYFIIPLLLIGSFVFCGADRLGVMQPSKERMYLDRAFIETQKLPPQYPEFQPLVYSVDSFIPFVDLHQENYWLPNVAKPCGNYFRVYLWIHIALGWIFSTLAAVSLTGLVRKE